MAIEVTPTLQGRLEQAVAEVAQGKRAIYSEKPGFCLMVARLVVSPALGYSDDQAWAFHAYFSSSRVEGNETGAAWARSAQRTMRDALGLQVPLDEVRVGDLVFNHKIDEVYGHVAVVVAVTASAVTILENTGSERGTKHDGFNRLSELKRWPFFEHCEAMRFKVRP